MVSDGQKANQAILNAAFMSRTSNTSTTGVVDLNNSSVPASGSQVANAQQAINETFDAVGMTGVGDASRNNYSSNNFIVDGDSRKVAIEKLDAQLGTTNAAVLAATDETTNLRTLSGTSLGDTDLGTFTGTTIPDASTVKAALQSLETAVEAIVTPTFDDLSPMTTLGDLIVGGASGTGQRLGVGSNTQVLTVASGVPSWQNAPSGELATAPTITRLTSGTGSYTAPANVKYIKLKVLGGGAGGAGSCTQAGSDATNGDPGGTTSFGTSLITVTGGDGGQANGSVGGNGGVATINSPAVPLVSIQGGGGGGGQFIVNGSAVLSTAWGGTSYFGGNPPGAYGAGPVAGPAGIPGTGGGGGGASTFVGGVSTINGGGGGAGGYAEAILVPSGSYSYVVGPGGAGGAAGTGGAAGGMGGSGIIIIEEYYNF